MLMGNIYDILLTVIILTEKLYDFDSYLKEFTAKVISCTPFDKGYKVILDKTAFFPEEGGQYSDQGFLNEALVFDVQIEDGELVHYCNAPLSGEVKGTINWERRFRNMQNHTGEHIISGLVHSLYGGENVGFHLGEPEVTCDYDIELSDEQIKKIELEANKAVYENMGVTGYYPDQEELKNIAYRSKKEIDAKIRIVTIGSVDCCACCAPHVKSTGEVGIIKIISAMRLRGGVRLFIACGMDAFMDYSLKHDEIRRISAALAAKPQECAAGVERIINNLKAETYRANSLSSALSEVRIERIEKTDKDVVIFTSCEAKALRELVNKAKEKSGNICAALSGNDAEGYSYILYSETLDLIKLAKDINEKLNGRGGGKSPMIQGSIKADKETIKKYFSGALVFDF